MRHSSLRSTIDIYTQAVTPAKRDAQAAVLSLLFPAETTRQSSIAEQEGTPPSDCSVDILGGKGLRVQKGHQTVSILHPRMHGETRSILLILLASPTGFEPVLSP